MTALPSPLTLVVRLPAAASPRGETVAAVPPGLEHVVARRQRHPIRDAGACEGRLRRVLVAPQRPQSAQWLTPAPLRQRRPGPRPPRLAYTRKNQGPLRQFLHLRALKANNGIDPHEPIDYRRQLVERWAGVIATAWSNRRTVDTAAAGRQHTGLPPAKGHNFRARAGHVGCDQLARERVRGRTVGGDDAAPAPSFGIDGGHGERARRNSGGRVQWPVDAGIAHSRSAPCECAAADVAGASRGCAAAGTRDWG